MKRRLFAAVLCVLLALGAVEPALAADTASMADVIVNDEILTDFRAPLYDGVSYVSLYWVTAAVMPTVQASWETDRMVLRDENFVMSAKVGNHYMEVNGRYLYIPEGVKSSDIGDTLVPARTLARALGLTVTWDNAVVFTGAAAPLASGDSYYNAEDLDLLARVITHESGNQPLEGKIAVGNVILNRVASSTFPNSVSAVLSQRNQFPGATKCTANQSSIIAAKLCLDGAMVVPGAYWFNGAGKTCWASKNKTRVAVIGGHAFYG